VFAAFDFIGSTNRLAATRRFQFQHPSTTCTDGPSLLSSLQHSFPHSPLLSQQMQNISEVIVLLLCFDAGQPPPTSPLIHSQSTPPGESEGSTRLVYMPGKHSVHTAELVTLATEEHRPRSTLPNSDCQDLALHENVLLIFPATHSAKFKANSQALLQFSDLISSGEYLVYTLPALQNAHAIALSLQVDSYESEHPRTSILCAGGRIGRSHPFEHRTVTMRTCIVRGCVQLREAFGTFLIVTRKPPSIALQCIQHQLIDLSS
jgi:hypothetical protein